MYFFVLNDIHCAVGVIAFLCEDSSISTLVKLIEGKLEEGCCEVMELKADTWSNGELAGTSNGHRHAFKLASRVSTALCEV